MATQKASPAASVGAELCRMVADQKFATQDEINQCLTSRFKEGEELSQEAISEALVAGGAVTRSQIQRLRKIIEESRNQQIPGYQILEKLGAGAMARVFKARQVSLDRIVAIKVLADTLSKNPEFVDRFYKEGKAAAKLNHPNIVQAIDVGEARGAHYFVMEYVEGESLYDQLAKGKVYNEKEALRVIIQIARALEHAHQQGLIHRDVKPKNIMMTRDGQAKLADMGLARAATDMAAAQAEAGRAYGTPYYISPEQIRGEVNIDFRADIYSLGATLYHLVVGRVPFDGATPTAVMHKHLKEPLTPPDHVNPNLTAGLGEVVEVMMAKDPKRRYASTTDLLMDLEAIAAGEPPLQARKQIDMGLLTGLATASPTSKEDLPDTQDIEVESGGPGVLVYILGAALALSVIVNIVLMLKK